MWVHAAAVAVLFAGASAGADENWARFKIKDRVTYEKRPVDGSRFLEYRGTTLLAARPEEVLAAVWSAIVDVIPKTVKQRTFLRREPDQVLLYDQVRTPVVSDRDVTILVRRQARAGGYEVSFETANQLGPPPAAGYVRIPVVRGHWSMTAAPDGGTQVSYSCYSEPGGSIPALFVRGAQQDQVVLDLESGLSRLPR